MRVILGSFLALTMISGPALAATPPEAENALAIAKSYARSKAIALRSVKVGADGIVCGKASNGGDQDIEFMVNETDQTLWLNESPQEPYSGFGYSDKILRSTDRAAYTRWKACQKGQ
jgi:hypothetical protein